MTTVTTDKTELMPGAEPWSVAGGSAGALYLHGFAGNPTSMRPVAEAFAAAGFAVELPRLPGHGTTVEDMITTGWEDWTGEAEAAYQRLAARCDQVVVAGDGRLPHHLAGRPSPRDRRHRLHQRRHQAPARRGAGHGAGMVAGARTASALSAPTSPIPT
jgi:hypothetical protein